MRGGRRRSGHNYGTEAEEAVNPRERLNYDTEVEEVARESGRSDNQQNCGDYCDPSRGSCEKKAPRERLQLRHRSGGNCEITEIGSTTTLKRRKLREEVTKEAATSTARNGEVLGAESTEEAAATTSKQRRSL